MFFVQVICSMGQVILSLDKFLMAIYLSLGKYRLFVISTLMPKRMLKLMDKEIITILRSKSLLI